MTKPANHSSALDAEDPRIFRNALGRFATGVTVVTCMTEQGPLGITVNSFASLSLDPPLVLWSPAKSSSRHDAFVAAQHYAIHVLNADQLPLSQSFARDGDPFDGRSVQTSAHGVPLLDECLARFECRQYRVHDGGDHSLVLGQVIDLEQNQGAPLVFFSGQYGGFRREAENH